MTEKQLPCWVSLKGTACVPSALELVKRVSWVEKQASILLTGEVNQDVRIQYALFRAMNVL